MTYNTNGQIPVVRNNHYINFLRSKSTFLILIASGVGEVTSVLLTVGLGYSNIHTPRRA